MTPTEYKRVRRYQQVLTAWGLLNNVLNESDEDNTRLVGSWREIREWLSDEQRHFESTVEGGSK